MKHILLDLCMTFFLDYHVIWKWRIELKGNLHIAPYWKNIRKGILGNDSSDKLSYIGFFSVHIRFSLRGFRENLRRYPDGKLILFK